MMELTATMCNEKMKVNLSWNCQMQVQAYTPYSAEHVLHCITTLIERSDSADYLINEVPVGKSAIIVDEANGYMFVAELGLHEISIAALYYYGEQTPLPVKAKQIEAEQQCMVFPIGKRPAAIMSGLLLRQLSA